METIENDKAHRLLAPRLVALVGSYGPSGEPNLIPASNVTSVSTEPEQVLVAIYKDWQTHENLERGVGFTLSIPNFSQRDAVWRLGDRYSGFRSSSRRDKLDRCGVGIEYGFSEYGPVLAGASGWLECQIEERLNFGGDHGLFVASVIRAARNPQVLDADCKPCGELAAVFQVVSNLLATNSPPVELEFL